jgi:hypothetical protein
MFSLGSKFFSLSSVYQSLVATPRDDVKKCLSGGYHVIYELNNFVGVIRCHHC